MKLKNSVYLLLLLVACKDGGDLSLKKDTGSLAWSFNQALAARAFSSGSSTNFSSTATGSQVSFATPGTSFSIVTNSTNCVPVAPTVRINNSDVQFESAECGLTKVTFYSSETESVTKDYYFISVTRSYDLTTEFISILVEGAMPKSGTFLLDFYNNGFNPVNFSYSVYSRGLDGSYRNGIGYYPTAGSVSIDVSSGVFASTNFLQLARYNEYESPIQMKFGFGCCSK
jgi:hypothetical protein